MKTPIIPAGILMMLSAGLVSFGGWGCAAELLQNQTAPLDGTISVVFVNDTSFRASFTFGTFNDLQRDPPGVVNFDQNRLAAASRISPVRKTAQWACIICCISSRSFAVGVPPEAWRRVSSRATALSPASLGKSF